MNVSLDRHTIANTAKCDLGLKYGIDLAEIGKMKHTADLLLRLEKAQSIEAVKAMLDEFITLQTGVR